MPTISTKKTKKMWLLIGLFALLLIGFMATQYRVTSKVTNNEVLAKTEYTYNYEPIITKSGDKIKACINIKTTPKTPGYIDFSTLPDASVATFKKWNEDNGFKLTNTDGRIPGIATFGMPSHHKICNKRPPRSAHEHKLENLRDLPANYMDLYKEGKYEDIALYRIYADREKVVFIIAQ